MKALQLLRPLILASVMMTSLAAEEVDPAVQCDLDHDTCIEKCDRTADGSSQCYELCEEAYSKCLAVAQGDPEEPEEPEEPAQPKQPEQPEQLKKPEQPQPPEQSEQKVKE